MLDIGLSTRVFARDSLITAIHKIKQLGFDSIEIWAEQIDNKDQNNLSEFKKALNGFNQITMHVPEYDLNIASPNSKIRKITLEEYINTLEKASNIGAKLLVVHLGVQTSSTMFSRSEQWMYSKSGILKIVEHARKKGIVVGIENMPPGERKSYFGSSIDELSEVIRQIKIDNKLDNIGIALDIGHAHLWGKDYIKKLFEEVGKYIIHTHLHDNDGTRDQHLPLGKGTVDYKFFLKSLARINYKGSLMLEINYGIKNPQNNIYNNRVLLERERKYMLALCQ
ncbi:MAG: sugar phosphate isomerase/epimerase family protein [Candidatus Heimdallarchaeaceae archaeon]